MATVTADYKLFTPLQLGEDLTLKNRVVHGPITCARANLDHAPNKRNAVYYEQCAVLDVVVKVSTEFVDVESFGRESDLY
uniref:NADH:flavin oxidoreductase/NADH oxidase N-terminal domain-containing protein n=1 Tax=Globisporangium ultimum (strain ATCC 200006 / CBS 805.95 / DAOM BR144) TaxID=431595 RepID=K3XDD5_GLOUD